MKGPWSWMMFILFVHAMLSLFVIIGAFGSYAERTDITQWGVLQVADLIGLTGFTGIGTLGVATLTMIVAVKAGLSPYLAMAYGIVVGLYVNTWTRLFGLINTIATDAGEFGFVINMIALITATAFAFLILKTLVDMTASPRYGT